MQCCFDDQMCWVQRFLLAILGVVLGCFIQLGCGPTLGAEQGDRCSQKPLVGKVEPKLSGGRAGLPVLSDLGCGIHLRS